MPWGAPWGESLGIHVEMRTEETRLPWLSEGVAPTAVLYLLYCTIV